MTSGTFATVLYSFIWVDREKRQRRELTGIPELAASIAASGLIHPPVVKHDGELIAGERRYSAIGTLGWTHLPVQWVDDLTQEELHLIELEENIRRVDISWQDQVDAIAKYHAAKSATEKDWTAVKTAQALNISQQEVQAKLQVAKAIAGGNALVKAAPLYSTARGIVERDQERKRTSGLQVFKKTREVPLLLADFHEWQPNYSGEPFNLIHCDFPYGIRADDADQGAGDKYGTYDDGPEVYFGLIETLTAAMVNVVAPSAHLLFWFSMDFYDDTKRKLETAGWFIHPHPLVWHKSDNTGILPDPKRGPRRIYETCFLGSRGDRQIVRPISNLFPFPARGKDKIHMSEKPQGMLKHFLGMVVDEYTSLLDPTAGSASVLKAAQSLGAHSVLGLEKHPEFFRIAQESYYGGAATAL